MKKILGVLVATMAVGLGCTAALAADRVQGDADLDGKLTSNDGALVLQKVLDDSYVLPSESDYSIYCDVNGDGVINSADVSLIVQRVMFDKVEFSTLSTETTSQATTETTTVTETSTEATTIPADFNRIPTQFDSTKSVSSYSQLKAAINDLYGKSGNKAIYITDDISANEQINLKGSNVKISFIGVEKPDGTIPAIDFATFRDSRNTTGAGGTGVYISGSGYNFKNLIVKNAPDCGLRIKGSGAGNCIFENCAFKYNNNSGVSITSGGQNNTFIGVDAYRNCDLVQKLGGDADGFSVKLDAKNGNKFFACRAWENGDDGWDSYDHSGDLTYIECLCFHNGDYEIFSGKYDYDNHLPLDKNLIYVQAMMAADPSFEQKYNDRQLSVWPNVSLTKFGITIKGSDISLAKWDGNPNGFKFGSAKVYSDKYRLVKNCIAFGNGQKGFDQNNSACTIDSYNTIGFDNGGAPKTGQGTGVGSEGNYVMPKMNITAFENAISFNGANADSLPAGFTTAVPTYDKQLEIRTAVTAMFNDIKATNYADKVAGPVWFDSIFALTK